MKYAEQGDLVKAERYVIQAKTKTMELFDDKPNLD